MLKAVLISLSVLLLLPNFIDRDINLQYAYDGIEKFNPSLSYINSSVKMKACTDSMAAVKGIDTSGPEYFLLLEENIARRFYHSYSHYTLKENWIAALAEKFTPLMLASKVKPAEIFLHPQAACSQQAIVMMKLAEMKRVSYRKIGFPHHYALELNIKGNWYFFDPSKEPQLPLEKRLHQNWNMDPAILKPYYNNEKYHDIGFALGIGSDQKVEMGAADAEPAPRAVLLQRITAVLSKIIWALPLLFLVYINYQNRKRINQQKTAA